MLDVFNIVAVLDLILYINVCVVKDFENSLDFNGKNCM